MGEIMKTFIEYIIDFASQGNFQNNLKFCSMCEVAVKTSIEHLNHQNQTGTQASQASMDSRVSMLARM